MTILLHPCRDPDAVRTALRSGGDIASVPTELRPWCTHCGWVSVDHACRVVEMSADEETAALAALDGVTAAMPALVTYLADYCGIMEWKLPSGWVLQVFNDCGEWDYVQRIIAPDGRQWDFPFEAKGNSMTERIADWKPAPENYGGWPAIESCPP